MTQHSVRATVELAQVQRRRRRQCGVEGHAAFEQMQVRRHIAVVAEWQADQRLQLLDRTDPLGPGCDAAETTVQIVERAALA
ncbi:hypothetical protein SM40611_20405 [Xanthomonas hortorum pv. gardneri]|nr:hypothetical protein XGA_4138 [Xanthomonas hortorum ATCC 19865]KLA97205.1 hypothetical protein SM17710_14585 [Xanthomonas hortorum pv. gardneri]KLB08511.1 hypothetical protein SM23410_14395 [Xanthomonas hortorum pv. gardneri]KLB13649.1 hypothetical protein SM40611_20405 [Xanthomonas hortorum pv. gardneri]KLB16902.1 hypothetical protein SM41311_18955 [Xanthomonas hortorum pv. gardneri]